MSTKKIQILGHLGEKIYKQNGEPTEAEIGSLWVDLDEEGSYGGGSSTGGGSFNLDATLTQSGYAADAKAVGDALSKKQPTGNYALKSEIPTIPNWVTTDKPSYTKSEVGLGNVDNVRQYSVENPPVVIQSEAPEDTSVILSSIIKSTSPFIALNV